MINKKETDTSRSPAVPRGWRVIDAQQFRTPPEWLAGIIYAVALLALLAAVFVAIVLLGRLVLAVGSGATDDINKLLIGLAGIVGAPFVVWRVIIAANQAAVARESHFTTLFTKAVEQLGATREVKETREVAGESGVVKLETITKTVPNLEVRLGAIYALERIARDSERDHWPIMEVLCAYIRNAENTGRPVDRPKKIATDAPAVLKQWARALPDPRVDVQAALTVIGRRPKSRISSERATGFTLDLSGANLQKADLQRLALDRARLIGARLEGAVGNYADLNDALLVGTSLECSYLFKADLKNAFLNNASLISASLFKASLETVSCTWTHFEGAKLRGGFQNWRARRPTTRKVQALCSSDWMTKPSRS